MTLDEKLRKLTLGTKPVSELTYMKGIALLLAGMQAQKSGKMMPDDFLSFVIGYCLRNDVQELPDDVGMGGEAEEGTDEPESAIRKLWAPYRERILAKSGEIWKN
jgi:hypothetical protein